MDVLRRFLLRITATIRPGRAEAELAREVASHLALLEERFRNEGMSLEEARLAARRAFGGLEQAQEHHRDARSFRWLDDARRDAVYGVRSLTRSPEFTVAAAITLALGIGAATTIFATLYAVHLRPLAYDDGDRIVRMFEYAAPREGTAAPRRAHPFAPVHLDAVRRASTLEHVGMELPRLMVMSAGDTPIRVAGGRVSAEIFAVLSARPLIGRTFDALDERPGADNVVVIGHGLWQQQFGGRDQAIGETLILEGRPHVIVGVMPSAFQFPPASANELWLPLVAAGTPPTFRLPIYARLRDGASAASALHELSTIYDSVRGANPDTRPRFEVVTAKDVLIEPIRPAITVLIVAVVLVLLIACVNVANLVLARSTVRQYEMALRAALGASRRRLLRQHLTEGTLLAVCGAAGGLLIAATCLWWVRTFAAASPRRDMLAGLNLPRLSEAAIDPIVVAFTVVVSLSVGLVFGVIAHLGRSSQLTTGLRRDQSRRALFGRRSVQHTLVIAEVAMAVTLFVGSALMIRSFVRLSAVDPGFVANGVWTFQATLPPSRPLPEVTRFGEDVISRLEALPGVGGVAYAESLPMVPVGRGAMLSPTPSFPKREPGARPQLDVRIVNHRYSEVMGIRIVAGRDLGAADAAGRPRAMLVNETLARERFGSNAVGQRLFLGGTPTFDPPGRTGPLEPWEIVGVIADVRQRAVTDHATPQIFVDQRQIPGPTGGSAINIVMRVDKDRAPDLAALRSLVAQLDALALVENVASMEQIVTSTVARPRLYAWVMGVYAAIAISLTAVGIYGVIAFGVVQRTREIGIRMALGAGRRQVRALVVRDSAMVAGLGLAIGIGGAVWSSRLFEGLLFGITPLDRTTYAAVAAAFAAIAILAAVIPARRAAAVDPVSALRAE